MRKKRVMLWSLLCGIFLVGGASYLSKTEPEPLKAAEKTTATKTEKTAPVAKAKPVTLVARDEESGIPILKPGDLPNFYLSTNPDFTQWDEKTDRENKQFAGMPTGWTTVYSDSTNMSYYANPTDKNDNSTSYNPDNWDMLMQRSQILSGGYGTVYFNWQRVQGGGIKTMTSFSAKDVYIRASRPTLGVDVNYNPEMGSVFTVAADLQRTQMPTQKMHYQSSEPGYQSVNVSLFRGGSSNAVLENSVMTKDTELSVDKVFEMVLTDKMLDEITNQGKNKIQLTTSNRMPIQWNSLAFYATNLKLTLKDDFTGFTVPVGASFEDYFGQQDFVNQIKSAEYHGVADGKTVTEPIDLENITLEGILDHAPDTSRVGDRTIQVVFTAATHDGKELRGIAAFPLHVTWGNSVALGGGKNYPANMSSIAFSLLKSTNAGGNDSYELIANNGDGTYDTVPVNSANPDAVYYQVDYFAPAAAGETLNLNQDLNTKGSIHLTAKGSDTPADLIAGWGKQEVAPGGVLRVYMSDPTKEWLYQDDVLNDQFVPSSLPQKNYVFYQVTENGLEPMYTNQITLNTPAAADQISADKKTPASILSELFNKSTVANSKYLTPHEGTALDDYTFVWDFQEDAGTTSGQKNISANLVTQKNDLPYVFTVPMKPVVNVTSMEFVPWLPFYEEKWKDSEKDTIPAENSFVFRYSTDPDNPTEVVAKSSTLIVKEGTPVGQELLQYGEKVTAGNTGWLVLNNLGYYNGKKVAVRMSVTPEQNAPSWAWDLTTIGVGSKNFFNVGMALSMNSVKVKYEFLEQTADAWQNWKPIKISGYWSLSNMWDNKDIAIPNDLIKNIYSFNRNYKQGDTALPIQLKYAEGPDNLTISSAATGSTVPPEQTSATITYDDQEYFQYTMIAASGASGGTTNATVKYISSSYARIDIPAPEGLEQSVAEVTDKQYPDGDDKIAKPINQEFRQAIPYEDPKYQSQPMVWMLPDVAADTNTLKSNGQWTIVDETGTDAIKDGRFAVDNDHQNKVSAADITNDNLYDHTYTFQRNLVINDQAPVDVNSEDFDKDTNYLDSKGDVSLQVGEVGKVDPLTSPVSTKVNFAADLGFAYHEYKPDDNELVSTPFATTPTYGESAKEVPAAGTGLITHSYNDLQTLGGEPLLGENKNLMSVLSNINVGDEGYTLNPEKSEPALSTPVKFTTGNNSKLAYALGAVFTFDVTPNLDFGTPKIGTKDIRQTNDWSLNVANTPKASKISVSRTPFKAENVERLLGAQLLLNFDDNAALATKEIPVSTEEAPASVELKTLAAKATWTIDALATPSDPQMPIGFSLNVPAGNITAGKQYKSEITFTLTDAP